VAAEFSRVAPVVTVSVVPEEFNAPPDTINASIATSKPGSAQSCVALLATSITESASSNVQAENSNA
jgi:hypothetical protein